MQLLVEAAGKLRLLQPQARPALIQQCLRTLDALGYKLLVLPSVL